MNRRQLLAGFAALSAAPLFSRHASASDKLPNVIDGSSALGLDLFRAAANQNNAFISPFSIASAVAMTLAGARGRTETQMRSVMHLVGSRRGIGEAFGDDIELVRTRAAKGGYSLAVANRLFGERSLQFHAPFLTHVADHFGAPLEPVNFIGSPEQSRQRINAWVEEKTQQRIKDLLQKPDITPETRLVLTNAIWFKGEWQRAFNPKKTRRDDFHLAKGGRTQAAFMRSNDRFQVGRADGVSLLALPYGNGSAQMLVVLPDANRALDDVVAKLTVDGLRRWRQAMRHQTVDLKLPKFRAGSRFDLAEKLIELGMPDAFDNRADFSGIAKADLRIDKVIHKTFVDVGEEGTEAAAATAVVMGRKGASMQPPEPFRFHADRPFVYLIEDTAKDAMLFIGRMDNPTV